MTKQSLGAIAAAAATLLMVSVAPAGAQQRVLFEWSGTVDSLARISVHAGQATAVVSGAVGGNAAGRFDMHNAMPRRPGTVTAQLAQGHGDVQIVQQPNEDNNYTAIISVRDYQGPERVWLSASWAPGVSYSGGDIDRDRDMDHDRDAAAGLLHWTGDVDKETVIRWRGDHALVENVAGDVPQNVRADVAGRLPHRDETIRIVKHDGRGDIDILQQPTVANNYTAVIRVRDRDEGYGHYDFDVVVDRR